MFMISPFLLTFFYLKWRAFFCSLPKKKLRMPKSNDKLLEKANCHN